MPEQVIFGMEVFLNGLMAGVLYALVALGFVLIYKASGIFNYAQGVMALFSAMTLVGMMNGQVPFSHLINAVFGTDIHHFGWHLPALIGILLTMAIMVLLAWLVQKNHFQTFGQSGTDYLIHGNDWSGLFHGRFWRPDVGGRD